MVNQRELVVCPQPVSVVDQATHLKTVQEWLCSESACVYQLVCVQVLTLCVCAAVCDTVPGDQRGAEVRWQQVLQHLQWLGVIL